MKVWDSEQMWLKAKTYIDRANDLEHSNPHFPLWSALALELLARSALTQKHPVLNADPRSDINILYACGFDVAGQPRSLPIHSVYIRLEKIMPGFGKAQRELCDFLGLLRNQELHTAELPFDNLKESKWLPRFYEVCKVLCESVGKPLRDFLGDEVGRAADQLIDALEKGTHGGVKDKISEHERLFSAKPVEEREQLQVDARAAAMRLPLGKIRERCPACGTDGIVTGTLIKELPPVYSDDRLWIDQEYIATEFDCLACDLKLRNVEELTAANLEPRFSATTETSLHDLYEPDFVSEYDNM
jgi:hypothetical protein